LLTDFLAWSAPSAIGTAGLVSSYILFIPDIHSIQAADEKHSAGFGGQLGAELTDFVFILNDASAVKTFAQAGR
jgi:hypothetical protein